MRLYDYILSPDVDKSKWMETFKITSGLNYFGGKKVIGKYLMNRVLNMAERMEIDGKRAHIFIDAFTGGGKLGLSVPEGWFDMIVMNDLDYGVVSYFQFCKDDPVSLIKMIEELGKTMNEATFKFFAYNRCNDARSAIDKMKSDSANAEYVKMISDKTVEPLLAGAMTYWVVQADFCGCTLPKRVSYSLNIQDNVEKKGRHTHEQEAIQDIINFAQKRIPKIHKIMKKHNIIVERLDYGELIKKYNGKPYKDLEGREHRDNADMEKMNKLWYFDPPYHPATLSGSEEAPYMCTFSCNDVHKMTKILHGDEEKKWGKLEYFIKSDYNPKDIYERLYKDLLKAKKDKDKDKITKFQKQLRELKGMYHDFDMLEENDKNSQCYKEDDSKVVYYVECLGSFAKVVSDKETGEKIVGMEYIWCRGNYQKEKSGQWKYDGTEQFI